LQYFEQKPELNEGDVALMSTRTNEALVERSKDYRREQMNRKTVVLFALCGLIIGIPALAHDPGDGMGGDGHGDGMGGHGNGHEEEMLGFGDHHMEHNLILPQIVVGGNSTTSLVLFSLGNREQMPWVEDEGLNTKGTIHFFQQDGSPLMVEINGEGPSSNHSFVLESGHSQALKLTGQGGVSQGWVLIEVDDDDSENSSWGHMDGHEVMRGERLMATAFYTLRDSQSRVIYQVGVMPAMYERERFFSSIMAAQFGPDINTGVAILNSGSEDATITLRLRDADGKIVATKDIPLEAGHQTARFITDFLEGQVPQDFQGVLEVTTDDEGVVTLGLLMAENIFTSIPVHHHGRWSSGGGMMP
jgi:hypothetical protein